MTADKAGTEYPCDTKLCGEEYFKFPIGTSSVNFTASDRAGNSASCIFTVTVKGKLDILSKAGLYLWISPGFTCKGFLHLFFLFVFLHYFQWMEV